MSAMVSVPAGRASGWRKATLAEVATIVNGGTPKSGVAEYWDGGIQWLTPKDMGKMDGREIGATPRTLTAKGLERSSARLVPSNSVILSTRAPIGHVAINTSPMAFNQGCRGVVPSDRLDHLFLYYYLLANRKKLDGLGSGATFKELSASNLKLFEVPVPPLGEQKRIVAVLDQTFAALDRARAHAEANLANSRELFPTILAQAFSPEVSWQLFSVGELVNQGVIDRPIDGNHGETHPKKADFVKSGVPFIMASDLADGSVDQKNCYFITRKQADALRKGFAKDGDVLLSHKGTIGRSAILRTDLDYVMLTPQVTYYRVMDEERMDRDFLYYCLQSSAFLNQMLEIANAGSTRAYIGITRQLDLRLPLPVLATQKQLVAQFQSVEEKARVVEIQYERELADLASLRQSLLQKAFSGELT